MDYDFEDERLRRLATDVAFDMGLDRGIVKAFRKAIQAIVAAQDERLFYARPGWRFKKLNGDLRDRYSLRLNDQWRLILYFKTNENGKIVVIVSIADYH